MPTFYRKIRSKDQLRGNKIFLVISNAEKERIIALFEETLQEKLKYLSNHKK